MSDFPFVGSGQPGRGRLFQLCHQEQRAVSAGAAAAQPLAQELSDDELEAIRERAVRSFTRPD